MRRDEPLTEENHLTHCHEELLRPARAGHGRTLRRVLRECAVAESRVHRDVGPAVMARSERLLKRPGPRSAARTAGIHAMDAYERPGGRRRVAGLTTPQRRDAPGDPAGGPAASAGNRPTGTAAVRQSQPRRLNRRYRPTSHTTINRITAG
ncbi:hypothetical protein GCM10010446_18740 [Streptomyces enissocaesilis]|uniref:Transposase n=1 Tax=Streptomyces enissocaesilis TaxID=332589 RepID=A0ABN3X0T4_9ACTN